MDALPSSLFIGSGVLRAWESLNCAGQQTSRTRVENTCNRLNIDFQWVMKNQNSSQLLSMYSTLQNFLAHHENLQKAHHLQ